MNEDALSLFVAQVSADAQLKFDPDAESVWLESDPREAVLVLWLENPGITFFSAYKAYFQRRATIAQRTSRVDARRAGDALLVA
jgi:hypothetical protein